MPQKQPSLSSQQLYDQVHKLFFPRGKGDSKTVGFELELWPFRETADHGAELVRFFDSNGTGLIELLRAKQAEFPDMTYVSKEGLHKFVFDHGGNLTFEPGGQLEYSGPPKDTLGEAIADITSIIERLRCVLKPHGIWFFHSGLNPWYTIDEVGLLLDHPRYISMSNFFGAIGPYGQRMMRLSTSLQVNLDVGEPEIAQRRWLAANLLSPIFTALFGNSPFIDGRASGAHSYRSIIWQRLDPTRTGFTNGLTARDYHPCPVEQYRAFGLAARVMRLPSPTGELVFDGQMRDFETWMKQGHNGWYPTEDDWVYHLSTLFPEVRARGFFEVRFLDAQSKVWCAVPGILLTWLLYQEAATEAVIAMLEPYRATLPGMLETAAIEGMGEAEIAEKAIAVYRLAMKFAESHEDEKILELCERFFATYTHQRRNPAAELIRLNDGKVFTPTQYRDFERAQVDSAGDILQIICEYN